LRYLTDEASVISGSGIDACICWNTSLYAIHGSYPQATGLNIANPLATIICSNDV
jgi:3-isopropylmalate dehydrogenase